jgi:hypothetical protein
MIECFQAYQASVKIWEELAAANPALMGIPKSLLDDKSETAQKKVARMRRNYAFDRARYFLPVSAATNVMMIMSARGWVNLCQYLLSHPLPEFRALGELIRGELEISAPRMIKHARATESHQGALNAEFQKLVQSARRQPLPTEEAALARLSVDLPAGVDERELADALQFHANRYAPFGGSLQRTSVRFAWSRIAFAEIRDLNRHRTGSKYCPHLPSGFYSAADQLPSEATQQKKAIETQSQIGQKSLTKARHHLANADATYPYWTLLGTEYPFEHTTTADKFLYEAELRTGLGAHYRYAKHLKDALALWYQEIPSTRGLVLEGSAEPE